MRLTRDDAFALVRRSVESLLKSGEKPRASSVRTAARSLLARDSESLSERNFIRILQDAHAGDVIDLRKRGSDYEVDLAASAPPVSEQLAAAAPPVKAPTPTPTPSRAGAVPRGRGSIGGKRGEIPADLFSVGVVPSWGDAEPSVIDTPAPEEEESPPPSKPARKRAEGSKSPRARKSATDSEDGTPARRPRKPRAPAGESA